MGQNVFLSDAEVAAIQSINAKLVAGPTGPTGSTGSTGPTGPVVPPGTIYIGDILFNGSRIVSAGVDTDHRLSYGRIVVPSGFDGKVAQISVFEYASAKMFRQVALSQTVGDFTNRGPNYVAGTGLNLNVAFNATVPYRMTMNAGEVWYLNVRNEYPNGTPSCYPVINCNYAVVAGLPS